MFSQSCGCGGKLKFDASAFSPEQVIAIFEKWMYGHVCVNEPSLDPRDSFHQFKPQVPEYPIVIFTGEDDEEE